MTQSEIRKKYASKIVVKEVRDYEIIISNFDENNAFDRKVVDRTLKLSNKGYHIIFR